MIGLRHIMQAMLVTVILGAGVVLPAHAQDSPRAAFASTQQVPTARPWSSLSATQRNLLAPLQSTWDTLPTRRQAHLLKRAEHWATLTPERQAHVREHIAHWQQMTPEEREQARANRRRFHDMSAQQREQLHATFEHFQQLPPAQRDKLLREWHALTPQQRLHRSMAPDTTQISDEPPGHREPPAPQHPAH